LEEGRKFGRGGFLGVRKRRGGLERRERKNKKAQIKGFSGGMKGEV